MSTVAPLHKDHLFIETMIIANPSDTQQCCQVYRFIRILRIYSDMKGVYGWIVYNMPIYYTDLATRT